MKSLSLIGAQWGRRGRLEWGGGHMFVLASSCFCFYVFACFCDPQGQLDYQLQDQDNIVFISTLHGG